MAESSTIANDQAVLVGVAQWVWDKINPSAYGSIPTTTSAGTSLDGGSSNFSGTPRACVWGTLWELGASKGRSCSMAFTHNAAATYSITLGGLGPYTSTTPADLATLLSDLAAAITADSDAVATAAVSGTKLLIAGNGKNTDYGITMEVSGGAGTIACTAEPRACVVRVMVSRGTYGSGSPPSASAWSYDGTALSLDYDTPTVRALINSGGFGRLIPYVYSYDTAGDVAGDGSTISYELSGLYAGVSTLPS